MPTTHRARHRSVVVALIGTFLMTLIPALPVAAAACPSSVGSLTTPGSPLTQNFDALSNVAGSTTNNLLLPGWYMTEAGGGARDNEQYAVDTGASTTGDTYSYGAAASTERAFGALRSGTLIPLNGAAFSNDTGSTISSLAVAYTGEEWRNGTAGRTDQINFEYSLDATDLSTGTWTGVSALNFVTPDTATAGAKNGNAAAERTALSSTITGLNIASGACVWFRWTDTDASGADDGLAVDDFSVTPNPTVPNLTTNDVSLNEGNAGTTTFTFTVSLSAQADAGGVTFDIATADGSAAQPDDYTAKSLTGQVISAGNSTYTFDVIVNGDTTSEPSETFLVNVTNVTGATVADGQGAGTIVNDDVASVAIHDVQGNGASTPIPGATVTVEGVVTANFQGTNKLQGFFLQEEDADADADPATSEGIFVFCGGCSTIVAEGQRVRATGSVSEFNGMTEITASSAGSVAVTDAGNHLAEVTPTPIDLPIAGDVNAFYEAREGMKVTFVDTLTVSEYFEMARFGQIILYEGGRPQQFTETDPPSVSGQAAHVDDLSRRKVTLDDDNNAQEAFLSQVNGNQAVYYPQANGGFSVGTQGTDFFRGGDVVNGLTGVLQWGFPGFGPDTWRIRPTTANPTTFTVGNPRPATAPAVGGAIKAVGMNLLNYFTTIDTTSSNSTGPCGPSGTLDCRGADSVAELNRQRERASIVICGLNADIYAFMELENTTPSDTITDLLGAVNVRCGGAHPYTFVNTDGTLGTDAIRVQLVYRMGILLPIGSPLVDLDPIHNRPPTAQTFDVVDASNVAFGQRFTVVANHFKSKGCPGTGGDDDQGDGQGCFNATRVAQANRLLTWINSTVLPAAGDPDVLLLGDFNSYSKEDPVMTLEAGGYTDLAASLLGSGSYSYLFDGQLGHLDYGFASSSFLSQVTGIGNWHINADEVDLFDYNDEVFDSPGEATFEEKPDGSALTPPRVVFQPGTPYRASDHDPVIVGLFSTERSTVSVTKSANPAGPVSATDRIGFDIVATNDGTVTAQDVRITDDLPAGSSLDWSINPAVPGCAISGAAHHQVLTCVLGQLAGHSSSPAVHISSRTSDPDCGTVSNKATITTSNGTGGDSDIASVTIQCSDLTFTRSADAAVVDAGSQIGFTDTVSNGSGPGTGTAYDVVISDDLPGGPGIDWSIATGSPNCAIQGSPPNEALVCTRVDLAAGQSVSAHVVSATSFASCGTYMNDDASVSTRVACADLALTKTADASTVDAGSQIGFTVGFSNSSAPGTGTAHGVVIDDPLPSGTGIDWSIVSGPANCSIQGSPPSETLHCTAVDLAPGSSATVHVVSATTPSSAGTYSNEASLTAPNHPSLTAHDSTTVKPSARSAIESVLARIQALQPGATKPDKDKLPKAADALQKALSADLWIDPNHVKRSGGDKVFDRSKDAAQLLSHLIKDKKGNTPDATLRSMIDDLEGAARLLARTAIDDAIAAGAPANKVAAAESDLAKGDAAAAKGHIGPTFDRYKSAWQKGTDAVR